MAYTKNNNIKKLEEGRTIRVSQLPDCQYKHKLLHMVILTNARIVVLATLNEDGTWQAYGGYPDKDDVQSVMKQTELYTTDWLWLCENVRDAEQVKMMGDKLPREAAEQLFPDWKDKQYKE